MCSSGAGGSLGTASLGGLGKSFKNIRFSELVLEVLQKKMRRLWQPSVNDLKAHGHDTGIHKRHHIHMRVFFVLKTHLFQEGGTMRLDYRDFPN